MSVPLRVLLIRAWIHKLEPIRSSLRCAGMEAKFTRVDIEPALDAALTRGNFDIAIYDPRTPGLPRQTIDACFDQHRTTTPIIVLDDISALAQQVRAILAARHN